MNKEEFFTSIRKRLIVSCQAEGDSPFNSPEGVTLFAKASEQGGAAAIRSEGFAKTKMIVENTSLPVIGLLKSKFADGRVRITGTFSDVETLLDTGCDMIAIDGTLRKREDLTGPDFIAAVKNKYNCLVMADIATSEEAKLCRDAGADCVSTTLSGYTPETENLVTGGPDFELAEKLVGAISIPVIAEGRISFPHDAKKLIATGCWSVVVGTAITRPVNLIQNFVTAMSEV